MHIGTQAHNHSIATYRALRITPPPFFFFFFFTTGCHARGCPLTYAFASAVFAIALNVCSRIFDVVAVNECWSYLPNSSQSCFLSPCRCRGLMKTQSHMVPVTPEEQSILPWIEANWARGDCSAPCPRDHTPSRFDGSSRWVHYGPPAEKNRRQQKTVGEDAMLWAPVAELHNPFISWSRDVVSR
jgi:hypothetical protein